MDRWKTYRQESWAHQEPGQTSSFFSLATGIEDIGPEEDYALDAFDEVDDLQDVHVYDPGNSSSSPLAIVSSPTVSALQNRVHSSQRLKDNAAPGRHHSSARPRATPFSLLHTPPVIQGIPLVPTSRLPDHLRSIFKFELFNAVQSKCFSAAFETDDNMVLSAPTGSGKTVIMELALCRLIVNSGSQDFKIIYQAPTKSLCSERCRDWRAKFSTLGLSCAELTGDVEYSQLKTVQSAEVIITTPEKWDSLTRKWKDNAKLMQMIKLFLIDEVHILNESRGATLEAVVSRMKTAGSGVRFIALSATVPNSEDIAVWLGQNSTLRYLPAFREVFDEAFRPVKLEKHVIGYKCKPNDFALDSILTKEVPTVIARYAKRKPVMIFCVTKNSATKTANALAELWQSSAAHLRLWNPPKKHTNAVNQELQRTIQAGVAFHHGGLDATDRQAIEQGFLDGNINIVCSTSTLAVGINLPCYLVILKGTSCWSDDGLQEYSSLDVMQMLGRAGRPQFGGSACAVILTHTDKVRRYEEMVSGQETLESRLHQNLIEHLNAEIGIGTIRDKESAKKWLASSFLSVRLRRNPSYYNLENDTTTRNADELLAQICDRDLELLETAHLVNNRNPLRCTPYGEAMSRYYVKYETMLAFLKLPSKPKISEILNFLTQAHEFNSLKLRSGEKAMYKQLNQANDMRYPIKVDIALPTHKTSLLIQAQLGGVCLDKTNAKHTPQFRQDSMTVMYHCNRLIRCMIDMQIYRHDSVAIRNALELCRSLAAGVWDNTPMQLKQVVSVGDVTARKLAAAGIKDIETLLNTEPQRIEMILGKGQPFGSTLLKRASRFPNLRVSVKEIGRTRTTSPTGAELRLKCEIGHLNESVPCSFNFKNVNICFLCETSCGKLLDFRRFGAHRLRNVEEILLTVSLDKQCQSVKCHVMCDEIAGTHRYAELKLDIPKAWFPAWENTYQPSKLAESSGFRGKEPIENFDGDEIADDDFLAAEIALENIDLTAGNIGHVAQPRNNPILRQSVKRKVGGSLRDETLATQTREYRESKQLPNGNWTCQHTCKEEGKDCKHQCCAEGVRKPRKRAKIRALSFKPADAIKNAFGKASASSADSKKRTIHDIDEVLLSSEKYRSQHNESMGENQQADEPSVTLSLNVQTDTDDSILDSEEIDSENLPSARKMIAESRQAGTFSGVQKSKENVNVMSDDDFEIEDAALDFETCDWTSAERAISGSRSEQRGWENKCKIPHWWAINDSVSQEDGAEIQCREIPMSKGIFVSPEKAVQEVSDTVLNPATDENSNDDLDYFAEVDDDDLAALEKGTLIEPGAAKSDISIQREVNCPAEVRQSTLQAAENDMILNNIVAQAEMAHQKQSHRESQKEKWAKFPPWMFEEFGAYIDII